MFFCREVVQSLEHQRLQKIQILSKLKNILSSFVVMNEANLQSKCFQYAWNTYPDSRLMLFHVPNGGRRSKIEAMQFKAMGVIPGVADMIFIYKGRIYAFEFKTDTGIQSPAQREWERKFIEQGGTYWIVQRFDYFCLLIDLIICKP